jgi:hypothetical protein
MNHGTVLELTRDEIVERLERGLNRRLGRSAREVLVAYRAGKLDDPGRVADLLILADLLPEDDPLFAAA